MSVPEPILRCQHCGRQLEPEDCDMENDLPCCVGDCPLTEKQWEAQYGPINVVKETSHRPSSGT